MKSKLARESNALHRSFEIEINYSNIYPVVALKDKGLEDGLNEAEIGD